MGEWKELTASSQERWNEIAGFWDDFMGEHSNRFHREIVRPKTEELLAPQEGQQILDIACGNGNFSRRLAGLGVKVTAIDYSSNMIDRAVGRSSAYEGNISYKVVDATKSEELLALGEGSFDGAVANMALMDISDLSGLLEALPRMLKPNGVVVFSIPHPCFQSPNTRRIHESEDVGGRVVTRNSVQVSSYLQPEPMESIGVKGQPVAHYVFHRPLHYYIDRFVRAGFVLDGLEEPAFAYDAARTERFDWYKLPPAVIFRFRKLA
ncbi:class I SAM-dependent methyltransferase [Paenibacillus ferrarius]|uniref:class I SAM-dependent methyltransferase n=1 Tax=Paenibacillus ferrarius TaxID=1469647 RepID=UPI003D2CF550